MADIVPAEVTVWLETSAPEVIIVRSKPVAAIAMTAPNEYFRFAIVPNPLLSEIQRLKY
jgi:hypothetical protein